MQSLEYHKQCFKSRVSGGVLDRFHAPTELGDGIMAPPHPHPWSALLPTHCSVASRCRPVSHGTAIGVDSTYFCSSLFHRPPVQASRGQLHTLSACKALRPESDFPLRGHEYITREDLVVISRIKPTTRRDMCSHAAVDPAHRVGKAKIIILFLRKLPSQSFYFRKPCTS